MFEDLLEMQTVAGEKSIPSFHMFMQGTYICNHKFKFIMFRETDSVVIEALALPPEDRLRLADRLIESVPEDEIMDAWLDEAERRQVEWDAGLVQGFDLEDVLKEARARIAK
jgi:putative addiction module component (TIGR02574 family)